MGAVMPLRSRPFSGQSLVLFALALVPLMGMAGVALDLGNLYAQRRITQNAADAAAFAGARSTALGESDDEVLASVSSFAGGNYGSQVEEAFYLDSYGSAIVAIGSAGTIPVSASAVQVKARRTFNTYFLAVLNISTLSAHATAATAIASVGEIAQTPLWPVAAYQADYQFGQEYTILGSGQVAPGAFGFIDFSGPPHLNTDAIKWFRDGFVPSADPNLLVADDAPSPGTWHSASSLAAPLWLSADPGASSSAQEAAASHIGRAVIVPIYDRVSGSGSNASFHVVSFGQFVPTYVNLGSSPKEIRGHFIRGVLPGEKAGGAPSYGLSTVTLTR